MINPFQEYKPVLEKYLHKETIPHLEAAWHEPWRAYHGINHLYKILEHLKGQSVRIHPQDYDALILAAFFHDCYYNPRDHKNNEDESIKRFRASLKESNWGVRNAVVEMIEATKHRKLPYRHVTRVFWEADNAGFYGRYDSLLEYEKLIRKEFVHVPKKLYKKGRIDFLKSNLGLFDSQVDKNINKLIEYVNTNY